MKRNKFLIILVIIYCFSCESDIPNHIIFIKSKNLLLVKKSGVYIKNIIYFDINNQMRHLAFEDYQKIDSFVLDSINRKDLIDIITIEGTTLKDNYQIIFNSNEDKGDTLHCSLIR